MWCFVHTLVGSIVWDTRRKKCFQCQGGRKATGEWRDLLLCRYAMHEWVHADARQLRLRSHLKKDTFVVQKHYFAVYIFIQIKYYYTQLRNWWTKRASRLVGYTTNLSTWLYQRLVLKRLPHRKCMAKLLNAITTLPYVQMKRF